jgi:hypothetical protein
MAKKRCRHETVTITWHPETGKELSRRCSTHFGCGAQLSVGESNDEPSAVQEEIEAADLAVSHTSELRGGNADGFSSYLVDRDPPLLVGISWRAGWLAHQILAHHEEQRAIDQGRHDVAASVARHAEIDEAEARAFGDVEMEIVVGEQPEQGVEVELRDSDDRPGRPVTFRRGDTTWHDGPGWYYTIDDYPDEGSCGAFATLTEAVEHAKTAGHEVEHEQLSDAVAAALADVPPRTVPDCNEVASTIGDQAMPLVRNPDVQIASATNGPLMPSTCATQGSASNPIDMQLQPLVSWPPHTGCDPSDLP